MSQAVLNVNGLTKSYQGKKILDDIDFSINGGESVAIVGKSGEGKSTFLNMLALLDEPDDGELHFFLDGGKRQITLTKANHWRIAKADISEEVIRKNIGFVFQTPFMLTNFSAYYNIALPMIVAQVEKCARKERVNSMIKKLGLLERANDTANNLSGGERQRVAIARALVNKPILIFADEPTGNLDPENAQNVLAAFLNLCQEQSTALILVTHDHAIAAKADRKMCLKHGKLTPCS